MTNMNAMEGTLDQRALTGAVALPTPIGNLAPRASRTGGVSAYNALGPTREARVSIKPRVERGFASATLG